jgi:hypothetical protein
MQKLLFSLLLIFCLTQNSFALVDYSAEENIVPNRPSKKPKRSSIKKKARQSKISKSSGFSRNNSSYVPSGMFDINIAYSTISLETELTSAKINVMKFEGHFETGVNIYFDAKYWMADTSAENLTTTSESQAGNPEIVMGFNWLSFGTGGNYTNIDLLAGIRLSADDSELGASRTDKIIGVSTVKRFNQFALGLGYKYYLTGTPDKDSELNIGSMSKLSATIGWMVSNDIQFELEGAVFNINKSRSTVKSNILMESDSVGTISPKLNLKMASLVNLNLGATFISKKPKNRDRLIGANLWDVHGVYGTSINAAIAISI